MKLGRITKIELREQWRSESSDFTPWLAKEENIKLLSDTIGIELEVQNQEERVGPFRADILCKDTITDSYVLIENQLEKTDHIHLGQLLTYAAGLDAVTIVWIAQRFTEEHRAALDWLNENTGESLNFFGIEVELIKIGDSLPAPMFNLVSQPNDWVKTIKRNAKANTGEFTETKLLQQQYWQGLKDYMEKSKSFIRNQKPLPQHWTNFAIGRSEFHLSAAVNSREDCVTVALLITGSKAKENFKKLHDLYVQEANESFDFELIFDELSSAKSTSTIYFERKNASLVFLEDWPNQFEWIKGRLEDLHKFFSAKIKSL